MRILINTVMMIFSCKIKAKINEALTETFCRIHKIFNDESYMIFNHLSDETAMSQNSVFSSANTIITKKTIFVLNAVFQIIQLETVNSLLTLIECL